MHSFHTGSSLVSFELYKHFLAVLCEVGYACTQTSLSIVDTNTICDSSHWGIHPVLLWWKSWSLKGELLIRFH